MSGKNENKFWKFNLEGVIEFEGFSESLFVEAAKLGCDQHFRWKEEDVNSTDKSVPEEEFPHKRQCEPGQEEAYARIQKDAKLVRLKDKYDTQRRRAVKVYTGTKLKEKKADLLNDYEDKKEELESGLEKSINDVKAACDLFDRKEKLFKDSKAQALALLNRWCGPSARSIIYHALNEGKPKNAWKMLVDYYDTESDTDIFLNSVVTMMSTLKFGKKLGKVVDHMAFLEKLNTSLLRRGRPIHDGQLLQYLIEAMRRNTEAMKLYGPAIDNIFMENKTKKQAMELFIRIEHAKDAEAEIKGEKTNSAGAQFATVKAFAGTASARNDKKRKREQGAEKPDGASKGSGGAGRKKVKVKCFRCGGDHMRRGCTVDVHCGTCDVDTHADCVCWKAHPELMPDFGKKKVGKRD